MVDWAIQLRETLLFSGNIPSHHGRNGFPNFQMLDNTVVSYVHVPYHFQTVDSFLTASKTVTIPNSFPAQCRKCMFQQFSSNKREHHAVGFSVFCYQTANTHITGKRSTHTWDGISFSTNTATLENIDKHTHTRTHSPHAGTRK